MNAVSSFLFSCAICEEPSRRICFYCTKDTCANHLCLKCNRCSDCCLCEVPLEETHPIDAGQVPEAVGWPGGEDLAPDMEPAEPRLQTREPVEAPEWAPKPIFLPES